MNKLFNRKIVIYILPLIAFGWYLVRAHLAGPFYMSRIDPEYPYLLNGLNFAILDFDRIGHVDHPGTPFQLLTGIFIRIIHLFSGQTNIVDDVIARPEFYLAWSNFFLNFLTVFTLIWLGRTVYSNLNDLTGILLIQGTVFINVLLLDIPYRYIPDRFQIILVLILTGLIIKNYYDGKFFEWKFSYISGIVMGIGFMTKFNFLPLLIIPFIIIRSRRNRFLYTGSLLTTLIICFLPIWGRFVSYRDFIVKIVQHDSLYGHGEKRLIDPGNFLHALADILDKNGNYAIILLVSLLILGLSLNKKFRSKHPLETRVLLAVVISSLVSILIIAKHYKNYYVLPMVTLGGLALFFELTTLKGTIKPVALKISASLVLLIFLIFPWIKLIPNLSRNLKHKNLSTLTQKYIRNNITRNDYIFLEPTWLWGAFPENGLIYGISYVAHLHEYFNSIEKYYSNVITWEGDDLPLKYFRMVDTDNEAILKSGRNIYLYATPGRNTHQLCNYLEREAVKYGVQLVSDTVFSNTALSEYIIRYRHCDNWRIINDYICGFEKIAENTALTDDEKLVMDGTFELTSKSCNGARAIIMNPEINQTPYYRIHNIHPEDHFQLNLKCFSATNMEHEKLQLMVCHQDQTVEERVIITRDHVSHEIKPGWRIKTTSFSIPDACLDSVYYICFRYTGDRDIMGDDFSLGIFSREIQQTSCDQYQ